MGFNSGFKGLNVSVFMTSWLFSQWSDRLRVGRSWFGSRWECGL